MFSKGQGPAGSTTAGARVLRVYRGERLAPLLMLAPAVIILLVLVIGPFVFLIDTALHRHNLFQSTPPRYVGLDNFYYLFISPKFHIALSRMFVFAFTALAVEFVLGFVLAAWVHRLRDLPGMSIVRTLLTTPILVAPIVAAVMWRFMYQRDFGVINYLLELVGIPKLGWLSDSDIALFAIVAIDVWQWTPFVFLIVLAGMYAVPRSLYEAAELDRTGLFRQIFLITIPLLKRVLVIVLLLRLIDLLRAFEIIVATTQGGPGDASYTLPVLTWESAFVNFQMGDAAATSLVLLGVVTIVITLLIRAILRQGAVGMERR